MDARFNSIPWHHPALWQAANTSLRHIIRHNEPVLAEPRRLARRLIANLNRLFPTMAELCHTTCPTCEAPCCQRAWVWIDFKDLLFLHLAEIPLPEGQLLSRRGEVCRYIGPQGCRLERVQRPFICTWYLCPLQTRQLARQPAHKQIVSSGLHRIKILRRDMESQFIRATTC